MTPDDKINDIVNRIRDTLGELPLIKKVHVFLVGEGQNIVVELNDYEAEAVMTAFAEEGITFTTEREDYR